MDSYTEPTINATVRQYVTAGRNWYMSAPLNNTADYSVLSRGASVAEYNKTTGLWPAVTSGTLTRGKGYITTLAELTYSKHLEAAQTSHNYSDLK
ncbi:MAG: hypothetical protein KA206_01465 [Paludibacter sp.]|nr:hypothetical protein [Paludibacter sp.]